MKNYVGKKVLARGIQSGVYFGELVAQDTQEVIEQWGESYGIS